MDFLIIFQNLHTEIIKYLDEEDIWYLFSLSKKFLSIDYKFRVHYNIYKQINVNEHFKQFYPDTIFIADDSDIVVTKKIASRSKIVVSYNHLRSKCTATKFKELDVNGELSNIENEILFPYICESLTIKNFKNVNLVINCISLKYLCLCNVHNSVIKFVNTEKSNVEMNFVVNDSCTKIKVSGITENNKIHSSVKYLHNVTGFEFPFSSLRLTFSESFDLKNNNIKSNKYILEEILCDCDIAGLDDEIKQKLYIDNYWVCESENQTCFTSNEHIYDSLYFDELCVLNNLKNINKKRVIINLKKNYVIHPSGLAMKNCKIDIIEIFVCIENLKKLRLNNVVFTNITITGLSKIEIKNSRIHNLHIRYRDPYEILMLDNNFEVKSSTIDCIVCDDCYSFINELSEQTINLSDICKKYELRNEVFSGYLKIITNNVEEIIINFLAKVKRINVVGNPLILNIPNNLVNVFYVNDVKSDTDILVNISKHSRYRLRKTTATKCQYVLKIDCLIYFKNNKSICLY